MDESVRERALMVASDIIDDLFTEHNPSATLGYKKRATEKIAAFASREVEQLELRLAQAKELQNLTTQNEIRWMQRAEAAEQQFKEHTQHVSQFLNDMYALSVDPLHEGMEGMKVADVCEALQKAAKDNRDALYEAEQAAAQARKDAQVMAKFIKTHPNAQGGHAGPDGVYDVARRYVAIEKAGGQNDGS